MNAHPNPSLPPEQVGITERANPRTADIDARSVDEILALINDEDARVAPAVRTQVRQISEAVTAIVKRLQKGGRLYYFGAGTSGRLGVLDASEMPPTYGVAPDLVQGYIAGGDRALRTAVEGAEDNAKAGALAIQTVGVTAGDAVVGIAASGTTPWVLAAVRQARELGALTIGLTCGPGSPLARSVDIPIVPVVGPEVISGSSRMKAGTAQKMVLNMLSTATMIRLGKVYGNLMVDVQPTNAKLRQRAVRILQQAAGADSQAAQHALDQTGYEVKPALVMLLARVDAQEARARLAAAGGLVRLALSDKIAHA
jgi:N-acetylmuramic acid 6-phosphate etherase